MIMLRRATERRHDRQRKQDIWHTFNSDSRDDPLASGFRTLEALDENRLGPGGGARRHSHRNAEIVTYVREGALAHEDTLGRSGVIHAGEFQCMAAGNGIRHSETNVSRTDSAHVFQIWLRSSEAGLEPTHEQKRFSAADRRGELRVIASPDGRRGSLMVHQDALIYSALLDPGLHVVYALSPGRSAWLHIVEGEVKFGDVVLSAGDGAGITGERAVSLTAREETEILLFDLGGNALSSRGVDVQPVMEVSNE